ncbi:MAG: replicative DNA helicase [Oscillospiraceae bacterium]|mgnify:FL=1|nr:replicative DNA helicase [Bacteroidales bacterium]MDD6998096.1 replicative DNA helicase [Oscillospiraceae bacterium]MDY5096060.1 replicative DNA helicase [Oscillospiraceae bacterium]
MAEQGLRRTGGTELNLESMGVNLPYSMQAEQSVLGAALLQADIIPELVELLRPEMFYARQNGQIFAEMVRLFTAGQTVDFVTLLDAVTGEGVFESADAAKVYLTGLAETVPSISNVQAYAKIVQEKYLVRQLMGAAKDILEQSGEEPDADLLLESAEQKIYEIRSGRDTSALTSISSVIVDTLVNLQKIAGPDRDKYAGIPTGFTYLDTVLTGMGRSDLIILAARPGMGKTSFALNIATNVAKKQKIPVAIFSLEMTKDQLTSRILSAEAGIDSQAFRTGKLKEEDWDDLARASEMLHDAPIYMDDTSGITIPEVKAKIRRINQDPSRPDIGLVIIDYLQLMTSGRRTENRVQEISDITRNLKIMAKELNVPVIALSQLSRSAEKATGRSDHRPQLSDLRDSGSIEQDADVVLFLYRQAYYNSHQDGAEEQQADERTAECIVAKNRHGETSTVQLGWDGAHTRFMNLDFSHGNN